MEIYTGLHPNRQEICKIHTAVHLRPHVKYGRHVVYFHKTHTCSTNFCKELPYRISWKSNRRIRRRHQTSGRRLPTGFFFFTDRPKSSQSMLYREIIAVCSEIHTKHTNTIRGQNVELFNVKLAVHSYSYMVTTGP